MIPVACLALVLALALANAQPPPPAGGGSPGGMTVSGQSTSTACTAGVTKCAADGSSNYVARSLSYSTTTGVFTGDITTNQCSNDKWGVVGGVSYTSSLSHTPSCIKQTFPAPSYTSGPKAAPLRGIVGYSITGGVDIFGPFEAGFTAGQACTNNKGTCDGGVDIVACEAKLKYECGEANLKKEMLMDDCGGHANPYHYHYDLACDYNRTASGHSALIGVMLDGRGLYGLYESTGKVPTDLDACGGHTGPVPARTIDGVTYPAASSVYHYHTQTQAPFTVGCYGPVKSLDECKKLYSTCGTGYIDMTTSLGTYKNYDTDCPCFSLGTETLNKETDKANTGSVTVNTAGISVLLLMSAVLFLF